MSGDGETGTEFAATLLAETFQRMRTAGRGIRPTQHI